jgi:serine/threonine-protein kinase
MVHPRQSFGGTPAVKRTRSVDTGATAALTPREIIAGPVAWEPGTEFSRYVIDSRLAGGGMAEVWRARVKGAAGFERRIVIKTMLTALQHRHELVQMFVAEAGIAGRLSHPNIVHVFDFGQLEGRYFIAMEYVPGVTLRFAHKRALARGERLPIATALHVMIDVCAALHHLHEIADDDGPLGLVHRDLSPDNIIVSTSGAAKLIDFGAARMTARTPLSSSFVGKYRYAAPERIRNDGENRRADLYSVGVILYELLVGTRPFEGSDADVMRAATAAPACDPRADVPAVPAPVAEAIVRATAQDPAARFATARELGDALTDCLVGLGASSRELDVTAALASLLDGGVEGSAPTAERFGAAEAAGNADADADAEAVPEVIEVAADIGAADDDLGPPDPSSEVEAALCEVEILDASGPIRLGLDPQPPPLPAPRGAPPPSRPIAVADAPIARGPSRSGQAVVGWRSAAAQPPAAHRSPQQRAVELFDRGLELRSAGHHGAALEAWERALRLAPDNRVYQANVNRLREQLGNLRAAQAALDS